MEMNYCHSTVIFFTSLYAQTRTQVLTLVEVGEGFIVQFNGWRGSCTQNILKREDLVVSVWRQVRFLLFEDGEGKYITGEREKGRERVRTMLH